MSEFPNIEKLRKSLASGLMYPGPMQDAASFLLSLVDEGGRLVVEAPCEHGVFHDSCDQLVCGHELCGDGWYIDARAECWCPGGSRRVVWPADKEAVNG